jgi:hypothetical protein
VVQNAIATIVYSKCCFSTSTESSTVANQDSCMSCKDYTATAMAIHNMSCLQYLEKILGSTSCSRDKRVHFYCFSNSDFDLKN